MQDAAALPPASDRFWPSANVHRAQYQGCRSRLRPPVCLGMARPFITSVDYPDRREQSAPERPFHLAASPGMLCGMPVSTSLASKVLELHRLGYEIPEIARQLRLAIEEVDEVYRMLLIPPNVPHEPSSTHPLPRERDAALDRAPKRMQDRILKARRG